jgi:outer membrane protein assembly factor BamD (BamD/ComL family)
MSLGRPLAALSTGSHEVEHYLVLLPLLHSPSRFDAGLLEVLPAWVLAAGRRSELADFCLLGLGRLDAAVAIVTHPVDKKGLRNSAYEYFLSAVEKCQKNNRPDLAVECLRSAIALLAKDDPEVLALRLKIYRIWSDRGNYDLAAGEAKQILDDFPSGDHVGEVAYFRMLCLARQGDSKAIRMEIDDLLADSRCSLYAQRLLYLKWYALQKEGNSEAAWLVVQQYVSKYPQSPYAADMRFAAAVQFFHEGRHAEAVRQLEEFATDYPDGKHTKAAKALLKQLRKVVRENATNASFGKAPED